MGTQLLDPAVTSTHTLLTRTLFSANPIRFSPISNHRCCSTRYGGGGGRSRWYTNRGKTGGSQQFNFDLEDELLTDDDEALGFRKRKNKNNQRVWWSDDDCDDDGCFFDDEDDEFGGVLEGSIAWIPKVFRAFGWMVPAVVISVLLGTGPNTFLMALALPLAQSALSIVVDTLWRRPNDNLRSKPRTKRARPFAKATTASNVGTSKARKQTSGNEASVKKDKRNTSRFGGWDELDKQGRTEKFSSIMQTTKGNEQSQQQTNGKLDRRARSRDKPLVLRLLIAIFPFLGYWTKLL